MRYKIYRIDTYSVNVIFCYYRLIKIKKKKGKILLIISVLTMINIYNI